MLNMGFVDDVETILNAANKSADGSTAAAAGPGTNASGEALQTLLFSATMPVWVKDITRRFLVPGHKLVDLVGDDKLKVGLLSFGWGRGGGAEGREGVCGNRAHNCSSSNHHTKFVPLAWPLAPTAAASHTQPPHLLCVLPPPPPRTPPFPACCRLLPLCAT